MKKHKDLLTGIAAALFVCLLFIMASGVTVRADDGAEDPGTAYYADIKLDFNCAFYDGDSHCRISAMPGLSGDIVIPARVIVKAGDGISSVQNGDPPKTYNVTEISSFQNSGITSVTISEGITTISASAFLNCTSLGGDLTIPDSVTVIGSRAFDGCAGLTGNLTLGSGLTVIDSTAFHGCGFTGNLTIPDSVTRIGNSAFQDCKGFTGDLTIPSSVTETGVDAFKGCSGFNGTLTIPASASRKGRTFQLCSGFTGLVLSPGITEIPGEEFYGCSGMTGPLVIPDSVTYIGYNAFEGCSGFTGTLSIPSGVTEISQYAFKDCSGFTGLSLSSGISVIGDAAFKNCTGMTGTLEIPDTLTKVSPDVFMNCGFTGDLTLPESLTRIDSGAFACPAINGTLTIPESVAGNVANNAFSGMFNVEKIVNKSSSSPYLRYNFIAEDDEETYFVKKGTKEHLKKYTYVTGGKIQERIGQGEYLRNGNGLPAASVVTAPAAKTLSYNGTEQELVTAGSAEGGVMYYASGSSPTTAPADSVYSESVPTGTDAGTYYVWYKAMGDADNLDSEPACITVTINPKTGPDDKDTPSGGGDTKPDDKDTPSGGGDTRPDDKDTPSGGGDTKPDKDDGKDSPSGEGSEKSAQPVKITKSDKSVGYTTLKKAAKTYTLVTVTGNKGNLSFAKADGSSKYAAVNPNTGKITMKKGTPAGSYTVKVMVKAAGTEGYTEYANTVSVKVTVKKAKQPMTVKPVKKTANYSKVKKAAVRVKGAARVSNAQGKVSYKKLTSAKAKKLNGYKYLTVNSKNGQITVKKGTKKGTYKILVRVSAAGNKNYIKGNKDVTLTVKVQ